MVSPALSTWPTAHAFVAVVAARPLKVVTEPDGSAGTAWDFQVLPFQWSMGRTAPTAQTLAVEVVATPKRLMNPFGFVIPSPVVTRVHVLPFQRSVTV